MTCRCIYCGSLNIIKNEFRKTTRRGKIQKFLCKECNKSFVVDKGFKHRHYNENTIIRTLYLTLKLSLREITRLYGISRTTILNWLKTYSTKIFGFLKNKTPYRARTLHMNELFLRMNSTFRYLWVSIDSETRFAFSGFFQKLEVVMTLLNL